MKISPFILIGDAQRQWLQEYFSARLTQWQGEWCPDAVSISLQKIEGSYEFAPPTADVQKKCAFFQGVNKTNWALVEWAEDLGRLLCGVDKVNQQQRTDVGALLTKVVEAALTALLEQVFSDGFISSPQRSIPTSFNPSSSCEGHKFIKLILGSDGVLFSVWMPILATMHEGLGRSATSSTEQAHSAPLTPPLAAIANETLQGDIILGEAELTVGALSQLQVGDVVELDKALVEPIALVFNNSNTHFLGHLGKEGQQYAMRVNRVGKSNY